MKLKRLFLQGFKSFADRTELRFHDGITAIVGPNGCGKSNISDAIRWVLGEQRASAIRGSKMEEAIFQGTTERRALNRAEVSLTFSNEDRRLAVPYEEIEIRRIIFREGGSEYQLNRQACRLQDIRDLYRDTGLATNSYTVIEQRMVDGILSDKTDERRQLFEEAAGVGRYKERRKAAQRRLEAAEADLARLEDVIAEVSSKVGGLARQKRRAQRYAELRARRLALEVTLATAELEARRDELARTTERLAALAKDEPARKAELAAAETELERRRVEAAEAARTRGTAAQRLEEVVRRVAERDRELAVAEERRVHAERRIARIAEEREELKRRVAELERDVESLTVQRDEGAARLETLTATLEAVQERQQSLREEVVEARRLDEQARQREKELARRMADAEAAAASADARAAESVARLQRLDRERAELIEELSRISQQGDLFAEQTRALNARVAEREAERDAARERLDALREAEGEARRAFAAAEERANLLAAQAAALEALERDFHGFRPAVAAVLAARESIDGLLGPLAERLDLAADRAVHVEGALGSLLQVLVVRDAAAAERVRARLAEAGAEDGAVAIVTEAAVPRIEALLDEMLFAGGAAGEPALIGRRERLEALRVEAHAAADEREARARAREEAGEAVAAAESALRECEAALQAAQLEVRRAEAEELARSGQVQRLERSRAELDRQHAALVAAAHQAKGDADAARRERARLEAELEAHRATWQARTDAIAEREAAWEAVREEESELRVTHARAEGALAEVSRRLHAAREGITQAGDRAAALEREATEHRDTLAALEELRSTAGAQLEALFAERDRLAGELRALDENLARATEAAEELESRVRTLRRTGEEAAEERHRLELVRAEGEAAERSVRERLEAEWGRPFAQLVAEAEPVEGEPHQLRAELKALAADIERLGPINMLAVEEHEEESKRLEFLTGQRDDLVRAREDLEAAIRQINKTARELFLETFERIRQNFAGTFEALFEGGSCDLWLADPDDPLESPIEISASPRGKRTQRIHLLSGGERALTALSLLFAIYLVKPSPFCVLDEVDAPLDEANVGRFIAMLQKFKADTQFIVITHNPRTMEAADWIYGVTMEEPGVSTIVGVRLDEVLAAEGAAD
ncbi:MAG TPA: AAA family ATPase [Longimicrobiales bacterium]